MNFRQQLLPCVVTTVVIALLLTFAATTFRQVSAARRGPDSFAAGLLFFPSATLPVLHALLSP